MNENNQRPDWSERTAEARQQVQDERSHIHTLLELCRQPFPEEALDDHKVGDRVLKSIRAQYVVARLNSVFGHPGDTGWTFKHKLHLEKDGMVLVVGRITVNHLRIATPWQYGGARWQSGGMAADVHKSAVTDCLTKCASYLGIGEQVFMGQIAPQDDHYKPEDDHPGMQKEQELSSGIDWAEFCSKMEATLGAAVTVADLRNMMDFVRTRQEHGLAEDMVKYLVDCGKSGWISCSKERVITTS